MPTSAVDLSADLDTAQRDRVILNDQELLPLYSQLLDATQRLDALDVTDDMSISRPPLPPELFEHVLDMCEGDIESLKVFSLVCQDWAAYTRRYRFARIVLSGYGSGHSVALLNFLKGTPYIRPCIRALAFNKRASFHPDWSEEDLHALLPRLKSVQLGESSHAAISLRVVERLSHLDAFCVSGAFSESQVGRMGSRPRSSLTIRSLSVLSTWSFNSERLWGWLRHTQTIEQHSLRSLTLSYGEDHDLTRGKDILLKMISASPQLEHLGLHLVRRFNVPSYLFSMELGTIPITHLTVAMAPSKFALLTIVRFVNASTWPNLRHLEIKIISNYSGYKPESVVCQSFRAGRDVNGLQIRPELLAALERITVRFVDMGKVAHAHRVFRMFGPALHREGLIHVKLENSTLVT